ncbi:hypothetical protein QAD02_023476 [Eretmocerus hayati]|uniref:Uncharacterized protein n=1 Tax=Eretmocerus hayati TaxID=131215 RepID=A0ACC2PW41_9HYME|nr:hypothetical protein QAD02_023476 [Eretmocerus hayati]
MAKTQTEKDDPKVAAAWLIVSVAGKPYRGSGYPAPLGPDGRVVDTPEVAAAKAAHLAAFSRLAASHLSPGNSKYPSDPSYFSTRVEHGPYDYRGPPAPLAKDGRVVETPEVARAKAAHLAAFGQAVSQSYNDDGQDDEDDEEAEGYSAPNPAPVYEQHNRGSDEAESSAEGYDSPYKGPIAPLAEDGRVVDTPEVARAKAAHLEAFSRIAAQQPRIPQQEYEREPDERRQESKYESKILRTSVLVIDFPTDQSIDDGCVHAISFICFVEMGISEIIFQRLRPFD